MVEVKQALTEAVLWPLRYPDSFARLGVDPPRGVLVYGPPGCGQDLPRRARSPAPGSSTYCGEGRRTARQVRGRVGAGGPRAVPPGRRRRPRARVPRRGRRARVPRRGQSSDSGSPTASSPPCSPSGRRAAAARRRRGRRDEPARADRPGAAAPRPPGAADLRAAAGRRRAPTSCVPPRPTPCWHPTSTSTRSASSSTATRRPTAPPCCARPPSPRCASRWRRRR